MRSADSFVLSPTVLLKFKRGLSDHHTHVFEGFGGSVGDRKWASLLAANVNEIFTNVVPEVLYVLRGNDVVSYFLSAANRFHDTASMSQNEMIVMENLGDNYSK